MCVYMLLISNRIYDLMTCAHIYMLFQNEDFRHPYTIACLFWEYAYLIKKDDEHMKL